MTDDEVLAGLFRRFISTSEFNEVSIVNNRGADVLIMAGDVAVTEDEANVVRRVLNDV